MNQQPFCMEPFTRVRITPGGELFMCCFQRTAPLGNLRHSSFDDIWFGPLATEIREATLKGVLHKTCAIQNCPHAYRPLHSAEHREAGYPTALEIDLPNTHCNIGGKNPNEDRPACLMCERSSPGYKFDTEDHVLELLPKMKFLVPHLHEIRVQGVAESFWHDRIFQVLDALEFDASRHGAAVCTTTNGIILDLDRRQRFFKRCPKSGVGFSLDAATPETYRKIRRMDVFYRVMSNFMGYAFERKSVPNAILQIHNNINLLNIGEVAQMVRTAAVAEVDTLLFSPTMGHRSEILVNRENAPLFRAAQLRIEEEARRSGVKLFFFKPLDLGWVGGGVRNLGAGAGATATA